MDPLCGSFWILVLYDVSEEIQLDQLRNTLGVPAPQREPSFRHPAPDYVRFERPPVVEQVSVRDLGQGRPLQGRIKYFDYGVISVELRMEFESDWEGLIRLSSRWIQNPEVEQAAGDLVRGATRRAGPALIKPHREWLSEDYYIIQVEPLRENNLPFAAATLLSHCGGDIARIVRGESLALSPTEQAEALQLSLSYYPDDLLVVGWVAAFVYDTGEDAIPTIQLLEYANTQLLEFRHYDALLTTVLADVYRVLERKGSLFRRWRLAREAGRLNTIRLDIIELTERVDNSIKFLSDMFYARAYRIAAGKVGVTDYRKLVEEKLRTAGELYTFMVEEFHQARAFVLELMVVAILVLELAFLFRK